MAAGWALGLAVLWILSQMRHKPWLARWVSRQPPALAIQPEKRLLPRALRPALLHACHSFARLALRNSVALLALAGLVSAGLVSAQLVLAGPAAAKGVVGGGASFPAPLYQAWARQYQAAGGVPVNYQAIGSGGGIRQIKARTLDFGASDRPLAPAELAQAGLVQFPVVIGGIVPIVHLPHIGPGQLRLNGALLAQIYLGQVKRWDDPRIKALNPRLPLLPLPVTVVHRSDGSGTSFLFTSFLAQSSAQWARQVGVGDAVAWPAGLGGKGNDGVTAFVKQTIGAVGFVEYAYTKRSGVALALLQNRAGAYPMPGAASFAAAAGGLAKTSVPASGPAKGQGARPSGPPLLINQPGASAWPITAATYVLLPRQPANRARAEAVLHFFDWAFRAGDATASRLSYVPLPAQIKRAARQSWQAVARQNMAQGSQP